MDEPAVVVVEAPPPEQVEAVADAQVAIAQIEAETRVEIATIDAETQTAAIEAQAEIAVVQAENTEEWRQSYAMLAGELSDARNQLVTMQLQIDQLTETVTAQATVIASMAQLSTPPPPSEPGPAGTAKRSPGRPRGSRTRNRSAQAEVAGLGDGPRPPKPAHSSRGAKNSFREFHAFLARLLDVPELEMSDDDAARFTEAYREVRRHFPVPSVDPKWVALGTFAYVAYGVYAPRVAAVAAKKRGAASNAPRGAPAPVQVRPAPGVMAPEANPAVQDWFGGGGAAGSA